MSKLRDQIYAIRETWRILREEMPIAVERYLDDAEERLQAQAQGCHCTWARPPGGPQVRITGYLCVVHDPRAI